MSKKAEHLEKRNAEKTEDYFNPAVQNVVGDKILSGRR